MNSNRNRLKPEDYKENRNETVEAMHFITAGGTRVGAEKGMDVSINIVTGKALKTREKTRSILSFVIRNNKDELIAPSGRTSICMLGNRIYFKDDSRGFKLTGKKESSNRYFRVDYKLNNLPDDQCKAFIGDYELKYNTSLMLYYIEKN